MKTKYFDNNSRASNPGRMYLNTDYLKSFRKELPLMKRIKLHLIYPEEMMLEHLQCGDTRAAVVLKTNPKLIVGAYTDELDDVLLLEFSTRVANRFKPQVGDRLLTVNTYYPGVKPVADLRNGPNSYHRYSNFHPLIADFICSSKSLLNKRKMSIEETEWQLTLSKGQEKLNTQNIPYRLGNPYQSHLVLVDNSY